MISGILTSDHNHPYCPLKPYVKHTAMLLQNHFFKIKYNCTQEKEKIVCFSMF